MDVSVIIVNWNTREVLHNCIRSVYEQAGDVSYEIIVVDNGSSDGSAEMAAREFPEVILIRNSTNRGFAAGNNQGVRIAKGRYILLLNSDAIVCDRAIEKTVNYADGHPEAAIVGCQVRVDDEHIQFTCFRYPSVLNIALRVCGLARVFKNNRFFGREMMLWWRRDSGREVDVVSGMFMLVRRQAIDEVGLMDESYFLYFEETDWCYRFSKAGWKMLFWPGARIIHLHGGGYSGNQAAVKMYVQMRKSLLIFLRKHRGFASYASARLMLGIDAAVRFALWSAKIAVVPSRGEAPELERQKQEGYRWTLKFCLRGSEPSQNRVSGKAFSEVIKKSIEFVCALVYSMFLLLVRARPRRVIIYYHGVRKEDMGRFEEQMAYLAKRHCVVKVSDIRTVPANGTGGVIGITFDDGLVSFFENALPILQKYNLPAAVCIPTGHLGDKPGWLNGELESSSGEMVMNAEQIAQLDSEHFEVFSHAVSHKALTELDDERLETELGQSRKALEAITGCSVGGISYPYGACDSRVAWAVKEAGYKLGFTIEPHTVDSSPNDVQIGRFSVRPTDSLLKFRLKVTGAYQVTRHLRTTQVCY